MSRFQSHDPGTLHRSAVCQIDSGYWFAKVVVMSERTTAQIRLLFSHQAHRSIAYLIPPIDPIENP